MKPRLRRNQRARNQNSDASPRISLVVVKEGPLSKMDANPGGLKAESYIVEPVSQGEGGQAKVSERIGPIRRKGS